jgi:hypothetical protein
MLYALIGSLGIEKDDVNVQWAAAGSNVTIYLTSIDPIHLRFVCFTIYQQTS